jgi:hypothetical protein
MFEIKHPSQKFPGKWFKQKCLCGHENYAKMPWPLPAKCERCGGRMPAAGWAKANQPKREV